MAKNFISIDAQLLLRPLLQDIDSFMHCAEHFLETLPEYKPQKWNVTDPINKEFDLSAIREMMMLGGSLGFDWKRSSPPKGWGNFGQAITRLKRHAYHSLYVSAHQDAQVEAILRYMKKSVIDLGIDYAYADSLADGYKDYGVICNSASYRSEIMVPSVKLQKNLPDILWSQVFGPPYVRMFGLDKILSSPAYKVEQLGPEAVYIQLSESLFDMHERYAEVDAVRQRVRAHLDDNIFFREGSPEGHVYRMPHFDIFDGHEEPVVSKPKPAAGVLKAVKEPASVKYDDASWHWGAADFPSDLPQEAGATHIGMYVVWALLSGLGDLAYLGDGIASKLQQRETPPGLFLMENFGGKFLSNFLTEEGNAFTSAYFDYQKGRYLLDYTATLLPNNPIAYYVEDSWNGFDRMKFILDTRLDEWRKSANSAS